MQKHIPQINTFGQSPNAMPHAEALAISKNKPHIHAQHSMHYSHSQHNTNTLHTDYWFLSLSCFYN